MNESYLNSTEYQDAYLAYTNFHDRFFRYNDACIFAFSIIGITSAFLTLITLVRNNVFSESCFICYQWVAISELIYTIFLACSRWATLNELFPTTYTWHRFNRDRQPIFDFSGSSVTILIVFLSLHRAVACLMPNRYYAWNSRKICIGVTVFAYLVSIALTVPQFFIYTISQDNETGLYVSDYNDFGKSTENTYSRIFDTYRLIQGIAHFVSSGLAILGMAKAIWLKRRLFHNHITHQTSNPQSLQAIKQSLQLCFLQLSLAIPIVCDFVFIFVVTMNFPVDDRMIYKNDGTVDWEYAYQWIYMWGMTDVFHCSAHCTHFYLYMVFSNGFRKGFMRRFRRLFPIERLWKSNRSLTNGDKTQHSQL